MDDFWNSKAISQRFELLRELGKGGLGTVYLAKDKSLDKLVAIKVLNSDLSDQEILRFQQEAKMAGKLRHANIVAIVDFGVTEKSAPYLVMEYLDGRNLGEIVREHGSLDVEEALDVFIQICEGMIHSHSREILHRDLKPENVILTNDMDGERRAKVVDFSLARLKSHDLLLTRPGSFVGSPLYASCEQAEGSSVDERSDIYSMGCLMYHTLVGSPPFHGETAMETSLLHKNEKPVLLSIKAGKEFPKELEAIVDKCLEKHPGDRFQTFQALQEALKAFDDSQASELELDDARLDRSDKAAQTSKRIRTSTKIAICAGIVLVFGAVVLIKSAIEEQAIQYKPEEALLPPNHIEDALNDLKELVKTTETPNGVDIKIPNGGWFSDKNFEKIRIYKRIHKLNLNGTSVRGNGFANFKGTTVAEVDLDGTDLDDEGIGHAASLTGLSLISIRHLRNLTNAGLSQLRKSRTLKAVALGGGQLSEGALKHLAGSNIEMIQLTHMKVTSIGIKSLPLIPKLRGIEFNQCQVNPALFAQLKNVRNLELVCISQKDLSSEEIAAIVKVPARRLSLVEVILSRDDVAKLVGNERITCFKATIPGIAPAQEKTLLDSLKSCADKDKFISKQQIPVQGPLDIQKLE